MAVIKSSVFNILGKFPGCSDDIKRLFRENREFQTICEDYRRCAEALHYWRQSDEKEAPARRQEYAFLQQELIDEIFQYLNQSN